MNRKHLSIYLDLIWSLSLVFSGFSSTDSVHILLDLYLSTTFLFGATGNGIFFFLLYWVLVVASRIFNPCCSMQTLSCGMWDLVPQPGINPRPPALGVWSLSHWTTKDVSGNGNFFFIKNSNCSFLVCKPIIDFCIFKMYPASFLFLLISSTFGG